VIENWFSVPVFLAEAQDIELKNIQSEIKKQLTKIKKGNLENPWGDDVLTTFKYEKTVNDLDDFNLNSLKQFILNSFVQYINDLGLYKNGCKVQIIDSWVNFNKKNQYQGTHLHSKSDVSGVYYFKADGDEGNIQFITPNVMVEMECFPAIQSEVSYTPKTGRLLMFPSWLKHRVHKNLTEKERISLSFNLKVIE
jgi:uncharacterized protein (TIGR02466 family)